jgi:hypothetical protein
MKKLLSGMLAACLALVAVEAEAAIYTADFGAPTFSDGGLIGQDGWVITGTSVVNPIAVAGGIVPLANNGQDVRRAFSPITISQAPGMRLQADINVTAAQTNGDYFMHLGNDNTSEFYARVYARSITPGFFQMAMGTSSGTTGLIWGADLNLNQSYTVMAQYNFVTGATNDTGSLFVDGAAYVNALTIGTDATSIASVHLRQGSASNAPTLSVDNISVTAVPEPSSLAVLGLIGASGVYARRRRAAAKA